MTLFGTRLLDAMHMKGVSAAELSRKSGISESNISRYLSGVSLPSLSSLLMLAKVLDVSSDWLSGREELEGDFQFVYGDKELLRIYNLLSYDSQDKVLEYAEMLLSKEGKN